MLLTRQYYKKDPKHHSNGCIFIVFTSRVDLINIMALTLSESVHGSFMKEFLLYGRFLLYSFERKI